MVHRYLRRPAEELYHTSEDPFEHRNLAGDPMYAETQARLAAELDRWMAAQNDPGVELDTTAALKACRRAASGN